MVCPSSNAIILSIVVGCCCSFANYIITTQIRTLPDSLIRLRDGRVEIEWKINGRRYKFVGGLINNFIREENSKLFKVTFAKEIRDLFAPACWTQLEWEERQGGQGQAAGPMAPWVLLQPRQALPVKHHVSA